MLKFELMIDFRFNHFNKSVKTYNLNMKLINIGNIITRFKAP